MKKAISLLIALVLTLSISVVAFAATDIPGIQGYADQVQVVDSADYSAGSRIGPGVGDNTYTVAANELYLVDPKAGFVAGVDTTLHPDETYKFDIYFNNTGAALPGTITLGTSGVAGHHRLTGADVGNGTVRLRTVTGSSVITSAKIRTSGSSNTTTYRLEIDTRANYGTKVTDVEYSLGVTAGTTTTRTVADSFHTFKVGFRTITDADTDIGEGGTLTISNDYPVVLKEQFTDIAKSSNYKNIIIEAEDGNWIFEGKVAGMKDTNFTYNYDPDTDLLNKFPEHDFKFVNFPAGVNFPTAGEMRIDVSDISDNFRTMHAYLYRDGKLTQINGTYDSGADMIVFRTNYLGRFIISDRAITDTSLLPDEPIPEPEPESVPNPNYNPGTGTTGAMNVMVSLGLISLVSAAAVSRKRK